ncbi:MAG: V-type ATP synthase subunit E [Lachnospiraceae bacterium]|nr:V-type ATP synthase subunit E [Lachnospiraceae bacterium]
MTTEEKLTLFYDAVTDKARRRAEALIRATKGEHAAILASRRTESDARKDVALKKDASHYAHRLNRENAQRSLDIRRQLADREKSLSDALFADVAARLEAFRRSDEYGAYLCRKAEEMKAFIDSDDAAYLLSAGDEAHLAAIRSICGPSVSIFENDFGGGLRAVSRARNLMVDNSFDTRLREEKEAFVMA